MSRDLRGAGSRQGSRRVAWLFGMIVVVLSGSSFLISAIGQQERPLPRTIKGAEATEPVQATVLRKSLRELPKPKAWEEGDPIRELPRRDYGRQPNVPKPEPRVDSLLGFQKRLSAVPQMAPVPAPILNVEGQGFSGVNPPDPAGDVSGNFFIQAINGFDGTLYTVYNTADGSVAAGPFKLSDLGGAAGCESGLGDPIVLFDHLASRWVLAEFSSAANVLCIYVSQTDDPVNGGWFNYHFATPNFPDYPHYAVWPDAYYVTSNESGGPAVYALERARMLQGQPATLQRFTAGMLTGFGFQALTPSDLEGPEPPAGAPNYLLRHRDDEAHNHGSNDTSQDFLDLFEFHVDWANPANSTFSGPVGVPIAEIDSDLNGLSSFSCFPQKGSTIRLDPLREVIMNRLQYRNFGTHETLVGSFVTDVDGTDHGGIRWFELRKSGKDAWRIHQEGTYAPDGDNRWMSSIAMNDDGDIAVAYSVSSRTTFPSLRFAGRLASDPMGTLPRGEVVIVNGAAANGSNRYGDYAAMNLAPDGTFWFTGQYNDSSTWSTRIAAFRLQ